MRAGDRAAAALLGGLLVDPEAIDRVIPLVSIEDFGTERARETYSAMLALRCTGAPIDFVTLCCELELRGTLAMVGEHRLIELAAHCPTSLHVEHYARGVAAAAARKTSDPARSRSRQPFVPRGFTGIAV